MIKDVKIYPNGGINTIKLGWTLYKVMNTFNSCHYESSDGDIIFKFNDSLHFFIVYLRNYGVNLIFESFSQRLILIEIKLNESDDINYEYKNEIIQKFNFKLIYNRYFGPTCEGHNDLENNAYFLSYCGITFKFNMIKKGENGDESNSISNEILNTMVTDMDCSSILIYQNNEKSDLTSFLWTNYSNLLFNTIKLKPSIEYLDSLIKLCPLILNDDKTSIKIKYSVYDYSKRDSIEIKFYNHPLGLESFDIKFGTTTIQEIIRIFGLPTDSILKRKARSNCIQMKKFKISNQKNNEGDFEFTTSRSYLPTSMINPRFDLSVLINGINSNSNSFEKFNQETIKIHNYFNFGFDVIYDLNVSENGSNVVSRLILHQNCIKSVDFLKYEKMLVFFTNGNDENAGGSDLQTNLKFDDINGILKLSKLPVFLDRKEYNIQEDFESQLKESDRIFEFVDINNDCNEGDGSDYDNQLDGCGSNNTNGVEDNNVDLKYWGLTNYDGSNGAIFEALSNTGELSTLTLY